MNTVNLKINNIPVVAPEGATILEAAHLVGIRIPTLCYLKEINAIGACRICVCEVKGARGLAAACVMPVGEGMEVFTNTPALQRYRRTTLELILSTHRTDCLSCTRSTDCELQQLCREYGVDMNRFTKKDQGYHTDASMPHLVRDNSKCILCRRCVAVCQKNQYAGVIETCERGYDTHIACAFDMPLSETACVACGQCTAVCPTAALRERDDTDKVWAALNDPTKTVIVGPAPSVRAQLGECFGMPIGTNVEGKLVAALRRLGFDQVFDVDTAADVTIMEEGTELLQRLNKYLAGDRTVKIPLMTSCCPGWVSFMEKHFPELGENLSTAKSPQQMFGAIAKNYLAPKLGIDRRNFIVVSVMPCVAKKSEAARPEFGKDGDPDVNISITTRELAHMIRFANMNFDELEESDFDRPLGESTGAGVIFGTTGGVIEAAVRTAYEIQTKKTLPKLDFTELRGLAGIRSATIDFDGVPVKIGIAHGLGNARRLVEEIRAGRSPYHAIEIMACPGGCINGGGQPYHRGNEELLKRRAEALYAEDAAKPLRKSHENPDIQALYEEFLGEPCGPLSHELLHTRYYDRKPVVEPKK